jgi:hypothetical protein
MYTLHTRCGREKYLRRTAVFGDCVSHVCSCSRKVWRRRIRRVSTMDIVYWRVTVDGNKVEAQ